jgi:hypothetical protein
MARPKKKIEELRIHQVNIRLTEIEYELAKEQADFTGRTVANWLRDSAFSKKPLRMKVNKMDRSYYIQLAQLGNNINQIAKKLNQGKYTRILSEIQEVKALLIEINSKVYDSQADKGE